MRGITHDVIDKAKKQGFTLLLTAGIDLESSKEAIKTATEFDIVKACIGVHPWYADEYSEYVEARFREMAKIDEVVAISEIGLDYVGRMNKQWVREDSYIDKEIQRRSFRRQLSLAMDLGLPALCHDRTPDMELIDIVREMGARKTGIAIHGFSKGLEYSRQCVDNGIYLSIGLRTIQAGEPEFLKAVIETPLKWILTETDSNNPEGVLTLCEELAKLKGIPKEEIGRKATENLKSLIGLKT